MVHMSAVLVPMRQFAGMAARTDVKATVDDELVAAVKQHSS